MKEKTKSIPNWGTRIFTLFLAVILMIGFSTTVSAAESELTVTPAVDTDGDGYVEIDTAEKLWWFTQQVNGGNNSLNAELTENIDLSGTCGEEIGNWTPIGNSYSGHFNGQGYTVSNLYMTGNDQYIGLFGYVSGATIENVTVTGSVSSMYFCDESYRNYGAAGGIVAYLYGGTIRNCHVNMTVVGGNNIGGICGHLDGGIIEDCTADGTVMNHSESGWLGQPVGGIVGTNDGTVRDCVNRATVTNEQLDQYAYLGGIAGYNDNILERCTNFGSVIGKYNEQGGIAGNQWITGIVRDCGNYGTVSGYYTGGIVSDNMGIIENCYNVGTVSGTSDYVAPVANSRGDAASVTNCYYLNGTATEDGGRTTEQFASGQVAYELNGSTTTDASVWKQTLGTDDYPVLSGALVYASSKCNDAASTVYSNTQMDAIVHTSTEYKLISNNDGTHNVVYSCCEAVVTENITCTQADCTKDSICDCGYVVAATHDAHDFSGAYTYDDNGHWQQCVHCQQLSAMEDHTAQSSGDCTTAVICECGHVITEAKSHSGGTATCTAQAVCENCGTQYGELDAQKHSDTNHKLVSNNNGTHNVLWSCCDAVVTENVTCTFGENNTCECGYESPVTNPVAEVSGKQYASLAAAVEAAQAGDTIKVTADIEIIETTAFALADDVTLDLNGYTVKAADAALLVKGNNITIKNGTFARYNTKAYYLLTIEDGSATLKGLTFEKGGVKIRNSAVVTLKDNTITANQNAFKYAVWAYGKAKVNIESGTYFGGKNGYDAFKEGNAKIYVYGGTYKYKNIQSCIPADAGLELIANSDGTYTVREIVPVAEVDGKKYETLQAAIDAAASGATVTLLVDIDTADQIFISKSLTLNLGAYTINSTHAEAAIRIAANESIEVIIDATTGGITAAGFAINSGNIIDENAKTTLSINEGNYLAGGQSAVYQNNGVCTINGGTYKATAQTDTANGELVYNTLVLNNKDYYLGEFVINGGKFYGFNPACLSINKGNHHDHDSIKEGCVGILGDDGWFTITEGTLTHMIVCDCKYPASAHGHCFTSYEQAELFIKLFTNCQWDKIIEITD